MCTSLAFITKNQFYFGRNLDLECGYGEHVVVTPSHYPFHFTNGLTSDIHDPLIGMAMVMHDYPLYYEAANRHGLAIAGLNFPGNAVYHQPKDGYINVSPYELIPYILTQYHCLKDLQNDLPKFNLTDIAFDPSLPLAPLHWMVSDGHTTLILESMKDGLHVYTNPYHVLTNNPPFWFHQENIVNYMNVTNKVADNRFSKQLEIQPVGAGFGGIGLPGDASPASRFVKAAFLRANLPSMEDENQAVSQFFHILDAVAMVKGMTYTSSGQYDLTLYSGCINVTKGIYYLKRYDHINVAAIDLTKVNTDGDQLLIYEQPNDSMVNTMVSIGSTTSL